MPTIFDVCQPRRDVLEAQMRDEDSAADPSKVTRRSNSGDHRRRRFLRRLTRRLKQTGIKTGRLVPGAIREFELDEGIERMSREEAAYWLGMAIHRKHPRRVPAALRLLLTAI